MDFPRDGFYVDADGNRVWYFRAYSQMRCEICEALYSNERAHPCDPQAPHLRILCEGERIKLIG